MRAVFLHTQANSARVLSMAKEHRHMQMVSNNSSFAFHDRVLMMQSHCRVDLKITAKNPDSNFTGTFHENKRHGRGRYQNSDGHVYEGEWQCHKMHGAGKYWHKSGWMYDGEW